MDEGHHARRRFAFVATPLLTFAMAHGLCAQQPERWIKQLGDPEHSEAAECALVALGNAAVKPLAKLFEEWDTETPRDKDRLRAALRVVDLLGMAGAPLAEILMPRGNSSQPGLHRELLMALGSLAPYASLGEWHLLYHHAMVDSEGDAKRDLFVAMMRLSARTRASIVDTAGALQKIADDEVFVRECAAEFLGRSLDSNAIEPLCNRLRDRNKAPKGSDQLQHNGFTVPFDDQFRLRAGMALMQLGPQDGRCAIGFGCVALLHPQRSVRLTALRSMASLGTECADAVPELLAIAEGPDAELAAEALKNLGMAGEAVNGYLGRIQALEDHKDALVQKRAKSLARRLQAMGATVTLEPAPDPEIAELAERIDKLSDTSEDFATASTSILAKPEISWPLLFERYRREDRTMQKRVLELLVEVALARPTEDRDRLRYIVCRDGDSWTSPYMSTFTGGGQADGNCDLLYAKLVVGKPKALAELAGFLEHENAAVRLYATSELGHRRAEVAEPENATVRDQLVTAMTTPHPEKSLFEQAKQHRTQRVTMLTEDIQAAAAAALLDCQIAADQRNALILKLLPYSDAAVVIQGIERWGTAETAEALQKAAKDARPTVKAAAEKALERQHEGK